VTTGVKVDDVATVVDINTGDVDLGGVVAAGGVQKPGEDAVVLACGFFPLLLLYSADSLIN
jgi:hypothetical protein